MTQEIVDMVSRAASSRDDGRRILACAKAFALAEEHGVSVSEIGTVCQEYDIKIVGCQLGCFK